MTIAPYMGSDSISPFLDFPNKWVIILGLTSNVGSQDFQHLQLTDNSSLYENVLIKCSDYGNVDNTMFVVGATQAEHLANIRKIIPEHFFLVPGVGAQGGSLIEVAKYGLNDQVGLLVNSSRGIIFADSSEDFANAARSKAKELQVQMEDILDSRSGDLV